MRVLITGAAGFIGRQLTKKLLERGELADSNGNIAQVREVVLADRVPVEGLEDTRVKISTGDFSDAQFLCSLFKSDFDSVFHLAATLTVDAEQNFELGIEVNLRGMMKLLEMCRKQKSLARFVFPSSIAAFGGDLPDTVDDNIAQTPQTSYGTHKSVTELLINDYSRHGFIDGRVLRLPIVIIRPGKPGTSVSDRVASIVREPLQGLDVSCPLTKETLIPVASGQRVAECLLDTHNLSGESFKYTRAMNLPSLTISINDMVQSLERYRGQRTLGNIQWEPDSALQAVVESWPKYFVSELASDVGIRADSNIDDIIDAYVLDFLTEA